MDSFMKKTGGSGVGMFEKFKLVKSPKREKKEKTTIKRKERV